MSETLHAVLSDVSAVSCTVVGLLVSGLYVLVKPRGNECLKMVHFTVCKPELRKSDFKNTPCKTQMQRAERGHRWVSEVEGERIERAALKYVC